MEYLSGSDKISVPLEDGNRVEALLDIPQSEHGVLRGGDEVLLVVPEVDLSDLVCVPIERLLHLELCFGAMPAQQPPVHG